MDASRSSSTSRSRRSYPNLHNLSLAPLSSKYPLDASAPPTPDEDHSVTRTPRTSYIAQKSAPTTPGILSLSQSRSASRNGRRSKAYAYDSYFVSDRDDVREAGDIPKAKSTNTLHPGVSFAEPTGQLEHKRHHTRKHTAPLPVRMPLHRHHTHESNDDWLHRAGLAIAGSTRDARGQGWLIRKESSTSLVGQTDDFSHHTSHDSRHKALLSGDHMPDITQHDYPTFSPRISRAGSRLPSRIGSRVPSARQSRRGSRVGSRVDLGMSGLPSARQSFDMDTDIEESPIEPDFVEADDEGPDDEEEIARLARERGLGMGGWMDALIGWTLFSVDEDGEGSEEEGEQEQSGNVTEEDRRLMREVEAKRRKMERESIVAASAHGASEKGADGGEVRLNVPRPPEGQEAGGWQDAAWLLSVATQALF